MLRFKNLIPYIRSFCCQTDVPLIGLLCCFLLQCIKRIDA